MVLGANFECWRMVLGANLSAGEWF